MKQIQFIGCGKMGAILLELIIKNGVPSSNIYVKTSSLHSQEKLKNKYFVQNGENKLSDLVFICVKPTDFNKLNLSIYKKDTLFISIMAGITVKAILSKIKSKKVIRAMPNTPINIGKGVIGYICTNEVENKDNEFFNKILKGAGYLLKLKNENFIDKITALSGSGPAYFYYFTEIIKKKALDYGFSEKESGIISNTTFIGAASLLEKTGLSPKQLRKNITSKGGTTQKAIETFEKNKLANNIYEAIDNALIRAKELNN